MLDSGGVFTIADFQTLGAEGMNVPPITPQAIPGEREAMEALTISEEQ